MSSRLSLVLASFATLSLLAPVALATTILVDDFDSFTSTGAGGEILNSEGTANYSGIGDTTFPSDNGWEIRWTGSSSTANTRDWRIVADPADGTNSVFQMSGEYDSSMIKPLGGQFIGDGPGAQSQGSFSLRFRLTDLGESIGVGLINYDKRGDPGSGGPWININGDTMRGIATPGNENGSGDSQTDLDQALVIDTWYTLDMDIDNSNFTYQARISGGAYSNTLLTSGAQDTFFFRTSAQGRLDSFVLRPNNGNANDTMYFDDIQFTGVPSPTAACLMALGLAGLSLGRRRS